MSSWWFECEFVSHWLQMRFMLTSWLEIIQLGSFSNKSLSDSISSDQFSVNLLFPEKPLINDPRIWLWAHICFSRLVGLPVARRSIWHQLGRFFFAKLFHSSQPLFALAQTCFTIDPENLITARLKKVWDSGECFVHGVKACQVLPAPSQ